MAEPGDEEPDEMAILMEKPDEKLDDEMRIRKAIGQVYKKEEEEQENSQKMKNEIVLEMVNNVRVSGTTCISTYKSMLLFVARLFDLFSKKRAETDYRLYFFLNGRRNFPTKSYEAFRSKINACKSGSKLPSANNSANYCYRLIDLIRFYVLSNLKNNNEWDSNIWQLPFVYCEDEKQLKFKLKPDVPQETVNEWFNEMFRELSALLGDCSMNKFESTFLRLMFAHSQRESHTQQFLLKLDLRQLKRKDVLFKQLTTKNKDYEDELTETARIFSNANINADEMKLLEARRKDIEKTESDKEKNRKKRQIDRDIRNDYLTDDVTDESGKTLKVKKAGRDGSCLFHSLVFALESSRDDGNNNDLEQVGDDGDNDDLEQVGDDGDNDDLEQVMCCAGKFCQHQSAQGSIKGSIIGNNGHTCVVCKKPMHGGICSDGKSDEMTSMTCKQCGVDAILSAEEPAKELRSNLNRFLRDNLKKQIRQIGTTFEEHIKTEISYLKGNESDIVTCEQYLQRMEGSTMHGSIVEIRAFTEFYKARVNVVSNPRNRPQPVNDMWKIRSTDDTDEMDDSVLTYYLYHTAIEHFEHFDFLEVTNTRPAAVKAAADEAAAAAAAAGAGTAAAGAGTAAAGAGTGTAAGAGTETAAGAATPERTTGGGRKRGTQASATPEVNSRGRKRSVEYLYQWEEDSQNDFETFLRNVGVDKHTCTKIEATFREKMKPVTDLIKDELKKKLEKKKVNSDKEKKFFEELNNMNNDLSVAVSRLLSKEKLRVPELKALIKNKGVEPKESEYDLRWQWKDVKDNAAWTRKTFFDDEDKMDWEQLSAEDDNTCATNNTGKKKYRRSTRNNADKKKPPLVSP